MTFYGPNFLRFTRQKGDYELTEETEDWFHRAFEPEPLGRVFEDPENPYVLTVGEGVGGGAAGRRLPDAPAASIGTPYEVQTDGCVVMVEDLNTEPYLVDTALNHLIRAGKLDNAAGFVFGTDVNLKSQTMPEEPESTLSIEEILDELIAPLGIPAIANVPVGHGKHMATMPLGVTVRIDGDAQDASRCSRRRSSRKRPTNAGGELRDEVEEHVDEDRACWRRSWRWRSRSSRRPPAPRTRGTDEKQVLRIGWAQDPPTLNPFVGARRGGLHRLGAELGPARQLQPRGPHAGARHRRELGGLRGPEDGHLQAGPDRNWSDGEPITSADVKYSLEMLGDDGALFTGYTDNVTVDRDARRPRPS